MCVERWYMRPVYSLLFVILLALQKDPGIIKITSGSNITQPVIYQVQNLISFEGSGQLLHVYLWVLWECTRMIDCCHLLHTLTCET